MRAPNGVVGGCGRLLSQLVTNAWIESTRWISTTRRFDLVLIDRVCVARMMEVPGCFDIVLYIDDLDTCESQGSISP